MLNRIVLIDGKPWFISPETGEKLELTSDQMATYCNKPDAPAKTAGQSLSQLE